jgi:hypothetical protein
MHSGSNSHVYIVYDIVYEQLYYYTISYTIYIHIVYDIISYDVYDIDGTRQRRSRRLVCVVLGTTKATRSSQGHMVDMNRTRSRNHTRGARGQARSGRRALNTCASEDSDSNLKRSPSNHDSGLPELQQLLGSFAFGAAYGWVRAAEYVSHPQPLAE